MNAADMHDPRRWWYGVREEELVRGLVALDEVYDLLGSLQRRDVLEMVLPGVADVYGCWDDLTYVLRLLASLDGHLAVSILQDRGEFDGLTMDRQDAEDRVRAEYVSEIRDIIRDYLPPTVTTGQAALVLVTP